jgi:hypothetical protein
MSLNLKMNIQQQKIFLFVRNKNPFRKIRIIFSNILAEEREELEVLNNFRQKQLELKHRQLLQELENIKSARETTDEPSKPLANANHTSDQTSSDSNFKHLM